MPYYPNLAAEMARRGVLQKDLARVCGRTPETIGNWMDGKESGFPVSYAFRVRDELFPGVGIEELFSTKKPAA